MDDKYTDEYVDFLASGYYAGTLTPEQKAELEIWFEQQSEVPFPIVEREKVKARKLKGILSVIDKGPIKMNWIAVAASIILVSTVCLYLIFQGNKRNSGPLAVTSDPINVSPGGNKAVLILADGRKINLGEATNGTLVQLPGVKITKSREGELIYTATGTPVAGPVNNTNTIATPAGGQYQVFLPDGTHVWLNAASSLSYPSRFSGSERRVELKGEAYFEVTHNKEKPFRVVSGHQLVEVLGTHFNVNSYADEQAMITTLEDGSVRVQVGAERKTIVPGQQTVLVPNGQLRIDQADMKSALAWKAGKTYFNHADLQAVMRQLSRWYDIKIRYEGTITGDSFTGGVPRSSPLEAVLEILRLNGVKFKLEEKDGIRTLVVGS